MNIEHFTYYYDNRYIYIIIAIIMIININVNDKYMYKHLYIHLGHISSAEIKFLIVPSVVLVATVAACVNVIIIYNKYCKQIYTKSNTYPYLHAHTQTHTHTWISIIEVIVVVIIMEQSFFFLSFCYCCCCRCRTKWATNYYFHSFVSHSMGAMLLFRQLRVVLAPKNNFYRSEPKQKKKKKHTPTHTHIHTDIFIYTHIGRW